MNKPEEIYGVRTVKRKLSKILSTATRQSITDMKAVLKSPYADLNMDNWISIDDEDSRCEVCHSGAVQLRRGDYETYDGTITRKSEVYFRNDMKNNVRSFDYLRQGKIDFFLEVFSGYENSATSIIKKIDALYPHLFSATSMHSQEIARWSQRGMWPQYFQALENFADDLQRVGY